MKEVKERPEEGQFISVWDYNDRLWCETFKWQDGVLTMYTSVEDDFTDTYSDTEVTTDFGKNRKYYVYTRGE